MEQLKKLISICCAALMSLPALAQDTDPYIFVLGVAQDAGYPQAGCYQPHCQRGWQDRNLRQGATSIALVVPQTESNYLFEATPHMPDQLYQLSLEAGPELSGVFLTHAHIGHYTGLMFLGLEAMGAASAPVYAMPKMREFLSTNGPWDQLISLSNIELQDLENEQPVLLQGATVTPMLVPHRDEYSETVGYRITGPNRTAVFIPDINKWEEWDTDIAELVQSVDYALIDGSFYADGELGNRDMSMIPHPFVSESMALLDHLNDTDKNKVWFIHFNHTNPLLRIDSEESQFVRSQGYNIATEGTRLPL